MSKSNWDAIAASAPVDANARSVVSKGYEYTPDKKFNDVEWEVPPPMKRIGYAETKVSGFVDHTGKRFGRLTVVGLVDGTKANAKGNAWVCRCSCGKYVQRRDRSIVAAAPDNRCHLCQHTAYLAKSTSADLAIRAKLAGRKRGSS